ncbi:MAG: prefoldin subunit [Candidatus Anstonellales archaeon]
MVNIADAINEFQNLQRQLLAVIGQKQQLLLQEEEIKVAKEELKSAKGQIFRAVGGVLIESNPKDTAAALDAQVEAIKLRAKMIEKQEERITKRMNEIKETVERAESKKEAY